MKEIAISVTGSIIVLLVIIIIANLFKSKVGTKKGANFPTDRIPVIPLGDKPETIEIQDKSIWIETVKASYPTGTQDGEIMAITSRLDRRCNRGLERHFSKVLSVNTFEDMILVHAMRIDNFTELHGMREVYEECHQHVIDLWTLVDGTAIRKRAHHHSDYVMGDIVNGTCLGGIWIGRNRCIENIDFNPDGKSFRFSFDGEDMNIQLM